MASRSNVTDNGLNDEDPDAGELLVTGLLLGHYTHHRGHAAGRL